MGNRKGFIPSRRGGSEPLAGVAPLQHQRAETGQQDDQLRNAPDPGQGHEQRNKEGADEQLRPGRRMIKRRGGG